MTNDEYFFGLLCVLAIAGILFTSFLVLEWQTEQKCQACFDKWNAEHGEHVWGAASNSPIYNGEFSLCQTACTSPLDRQLAMET